ncbi:MAG TPA: undecaprenyl-diphosphate phosphatase [Longimicrobiaceae bacterium]|nr:undecaprenyl-diphosphate phosphatase [Longimicrobiaceae bacterium]
MDLILLLKAAVLGVVEGATEFIPVSSTGHLILAQDWLDFQGPKENAFIIFIQLGAILAVVWLYREKFLNVLRNWRTDPDARRLVVNLVVGTIPAVVVGLPTEEWIEERLFRPFPVALALVVGGVAILLIERWYRSPSVESVDRIPLRKALGVGVFQVLAILWPGISRSGATIMGGLALGLSRTAATEFSFFLAVPAMAGATVVKMGDVAEVATPADVPVFAVGFVVAFLSALVVIRTLIAFVSSNTFRPFAWYRIVFGGVLLVLYYTTGAGF